MDANQIREAFIRAHEAGDKEAASYLAGKLRGMQGPTIGERLAGEDSEMGSARGRSDFVNAAVHHVGAMPLGVAQLGINALAQVADFAKPHAANMNQYIRNREADYQANTGDTPAAYAGAVLGELPSLAIGGGLAARGGQAIQQGMRTLPRAAKALGIGAEGAALGASQPTTANNGDYWESKAGQAAVGAALQGVGAGVGNAVTGVLRPSADSAMLAARLPGVEQPFWKESNGAIRHLAEGLKVMPQTKAAMSQKELQAFEAYNRAMAARGTPPVPMLDEVGNVLRWEAPKPSGAIGQQHVEEGIEGFNKAYGALYGNRTIPVDQQYMGGVQRLLDDVRHVKPDLLQQVEGRLNAIHQPIAGATNLQTTVRPAQVTDYLTNTVRPAQVTQQGGHVGVGADSIKEAISKANSEAAALAREGKHGAADYLRSYASELESLRMRGLPPEVAGQVEPINKAFQSFAQYRQGMNAPAAQKQGFLTPDQHLRAIMQNGRKYGGLNQSAAGQLPNQADATLAAKVLGSKLPDTGPGTGEKLFAIGAAFNPLALAGDWAVGKAMRSERLANVLKGNTLPQRPAQRLSDSKAVGSTLLRNAIMASPAVYGGKYSGQ